MFDFETGFIKLKAPKGKLLLVRAISSRCAFPFVRFCSYGSNVPKEMMVLGGRDFLYKRYRVYIPAKMDKNGVLIILIVLQGHVW